MATGLFFNVGINVALGSVIDTWRDWSTVVGIAGFLVIWGIAVRRPSLIHPRTMSLSAGASLIVGHALTELSIALGSGVLAIIGSCLNALGEVWLVIVWLLACSSLDTRRMCLCLSGSALVAMTAVWVLSNAIAHAPTWMPGVLDAVLCIAALVIASLLAGGFFSRLAVCEVPTNLQITHPGAVLPATHGIFVTIFAFSLAFGYAQRYVLGLGVASSQILSAVVMMVAFGYAALRESRPRADMLFGLSFVLVIGGFLFVLVDDMRVSALAAGLLMAGYLSFELLSWFVFCSVAARSTAEALPAIAWGTAVSYIGIFVGAQLGILTTTLGTSSMVGGLAPKLIVVAITLIIVAYVALRGDSTSFDAAIDGIEPDPPRIEVRYVDRFDERCRQAIEHYGLTQREGELLIQLARGNNPAHIQEALSISRNTVKYHCKNIYDKLGVHSQQEVIDLLSQECPDQQERSNQP